MSRLNKNFHRLGFFFPGVVVVCLALLAACEGQKEVQEASVEPRPVKMMTVGQASQATQRSFPGTVRAARRAELAFQVSGTLTQLPAGEGQEIGRAHV